MKFGKQLESEAEDIPSEWRPYLIHYKALKKLIGKVTEEIEKRGLSASLLHECLDGAHSEDCKIKYYFTGESPNVRPCIQLMYDANMPRVQHALAKLTADNEERPTLSYKRSQNNTDFFSLTSQAQETVDASDASTGTTTKVKRRSMTTELIQQLMELCLEDQDCSPEHHHDNGELSCEENRRASTHAEPQLRSLVIELEHDDEFFHVLVTELQQAATLQDRATEQFEKDIHALEDRMIQVASPRQKSDMYAWRAIFGLYLDAQVFRNRPGSENSMRSVQASKDQLAWFNLQLSNNSLFSKLKNRVSKTAFVQFLALNTELITLMHYQVLNQTAMTKILKKHDKRSGLTASRSFPSFVKTDKIFNPKMARMLCASVVEKLTTIVPQPDDYACPVCMNVAWRPIRLVCGHVFCVRCLIKAQKKRLSSCPLCRHQGAVMAASALNLDKAMQEFLKEYFPKEIKQKRLDNEREQNIEDIETMTGRVYSPEQIQRMTHREDKCLVM